MKEVILTSGDIFIQGNQKYRFIMSKGKLETFLDNPVMLFQHKDDKVIGLWDNIRVTDNEIIATPSFDDDNFSTEIKAKFKKGSIRSASVGVDVHDVLIDSEDVINITSWEIYEASLVSLPANTKARTISNKKSPEVKLTFGRLPLDNETLEKLKNKNDMQEETKLELSAVEVEINVNTEEPKDEMQSMTTEPMCPICVEKDNIIVTLKVEIAQKDVEIAMKDEEIMKMKSEMGNMQNEKTIALLDEAITLGKITEDSKNDFIELGYEKSKLILAKLPANKQSLSETILQLKKENDVKDYGWYLKNDRQYLSKLSKENFSLYKQIETEYVNKQKQIK